MDNHGYAGGILVACTNDSMKICTRSSGAQFIHMQIISKQGPEWMFTVIYAIPNNIIRRSLWDNMKVIATNIDRSWLVAGDFNDIVDANEKKGGGNVSAHRCSVFRDNIEACNLSDLGAMGLRFTWRGPIYQGGQRIFERLDRAVSNEE